jgi:beta-lactamase superfamily II metal-dependent hydrolase
MSDPSYDWGGVQFATFDNEYSDFDNPTTNNLSIVTFAHYLGWTFIFPGDLEAPGWLKLLENSLFRAWLRTVDIFVASHHGREAGYCEEVFNHSSSIKLVIVSDKSHPGASYPDLYHSHAQGLSVLNGAGEFETRYVLTTRHDGAIHIYIEPDGRYAITTTK